MRRLLLLALPAVLCGQDWQSGLLGLPERAPAATGLGDVTRFQQNIHLAAPHLGVPGNIHANRNYVRQMWLYLGGLEVMARQPGANRDFVNAVGRTRGLIYGMGLAYPYWGIGAYGHTAAPPSEPPPVKSGEPPFSTTPPDLGNVPAAEKEQAAEMVSRYQLAVARAVASWKSADVMRQSLEARGMTLNTRVTEAVVRLQMFVEMAAGDLRRHDWTASGEDIEKIQYTTSQLASSVGR